MGSALPYHCSLQVRMVHGVLRVLILVVAARLEEDGPRRRLRRRHGDGVCLAVPLLSPRTIEVAHALELCELVAPRGQDLDGVRHRRGPSAFPVGLDLAVL